MSYNNYNRGYAEPTMTSADYIPSRNEEIIKARKVRENLIKSADDRKITDNLKRYDMDSFSMHR